MKFGENVKEVETKTNSIVYTFLSAIASAEAVQLSRLLPAVESLVFRRLVSSSSILSGKDGSYLGYISLL